VETRQFSKLSQIQGTGISWPVFWDAEGILLIDNMLTITAVYYADLLHKLHVAVKKQWRGKLTKVPLLLLTGHMLDNPLHLNVDLKKCAIHHDQTPSDYDRLFPNLKKHIHRQRFLTND